MVNCAKIFGIERLRIDIDGTGVRSLVCFSGCPLNCKLCLNKRAMNRTPLSLSPNSLLDRLKIDDVYFKASSIGGVTFGGGEPSLQSVFIEEFRAICPSDWTVFIETSLNVPAEHIRRLSKVIDSWFIDIKDMNDQIYHKYTGSSNKQVISNLQYLIGEGLASKITARVPFIPCYNAGSDVIKSEAMLREMGIKFVERFTYYFSKRANADSPWTGGTQ